MHVTPYLNFRNQCREAFTEYAALLGGEIEFIQTFAETPEMGDAARDMGDAVMHASLRFPGGTLLGSDAPGEMYRPAQGLWVSLQADSPEEAERLWAGLAKGGTVTMPLDKTFWARKFGMVTDRFGTPWMINCT